MHYDITIVLYFLEEFKNQRPAISSGQQPSKAEHCSDLSCFSICAMTRKGKKKKKSMSKYELYTEQRPNFKILKEYQQWFSLCRSLDYFSIFLFPKICYYHQKKQLFNILCINFLKNGYIGGKKAISGNNNVTYRLNYFI